MTKVKYDFYNIGTNYGMFIAKCNEALIINLMAKKIKMLRNNFGEKEANEFESGVYSQLINIKLEESRQFLNYKKSKW